MLARLTRLSLVLAASLPTLLALAFGFVQTGFAKSRLESMLERSLAADGGAAEVSGLAGLLPFAVRLERLRLADREGVWLEVDQARLDLAPAPLLGGRVEVRELGAERVALHRLPPGTAEPSPEPEAGPPLRLPELPGLPESLPPVRVDRLAVPRLELGAAVLGRAAVLAVDGRVGVETDGRRATAALALRRIDEPTGELELGVALDLAARSLALRLAGEERGGLVAAAAGLERAGAARLRLSGEGPLARWQGSLEASLERVGAASGRLALDLEGLPAVELDLGATLDAEGAPGALLETLGERPELVLAVRPESAERLRVERLRLSTRAFSLAGEGALEPASGVLEARLSAEAPDLARLAPLLGTPLAGAARLEVEARGSTAAPELELRLAGDALAAAGVRARSLALALSGRPFVAEPETLLLALEGRAEGVELDGRLLGPDGLVRIEGEALHRPGGPVVLPAVDLAIAGLEARLAGEIDPMATTGGLRLEARSADLRALAPLLGLAEADLPTGEVHAGVDLTLAGPGALDGRIELRAEDLRELPAGLGELVGATPRAGADFALREGRTLTLDSLTLDGAAGKLSGRAGLDLRDQRIAGTVRLELPDLAPLAPLVGRPLAGRAVLTVEPSGPLARPRLGLTAELDRPALAGQRLDALSARGTVEFQPAGPSWQLDATARLAGETVTAASTGRLTGSRLELDALRVEGSGVVLALDGRATADLERGVVSGRVSGEIAELARLVAWGLPELAGSLALDLRADGRTGRQDLAIMASAERLAGPFGTLATARIDLAGQDLTGRGSLRGRAALERLATGELELESGELELDGPLAELGFAVRTTGAQAGRRLALEARGRLAALAEPRRLELDKLEGRLADQSFTLRQPARIVLDKGVLDLGTIDLVIGEAGARIRAELRPDRLRARGALERLPLRALRSFGLPDLPGVVDAELVLEGPLRAPDGRLELRLGQLGEPAGELGARASLRAGRELAIEARASGLGAEPLTAEVRLPVRIDLGAGLVELPPDGPLSGRLVGRVELARLTALLPLDGQKLSGPLILDLELGGRIDDPRLGGRAELVGGEASDAVSGLRLRSIEALVRAEDRALVVERLAARDRGQGRLAGSGRVEPFAGRFEAALELQGFQALAGELGTATLSGTVTARGDDGERLLAARLVVDRAELRLPDPPPPVPATIPVEEIGRGARPDPEPGARPPPPWRLDVRVEAERRLFVRGRGLDSEWQGRVRARGTLDEPDVVGRIELRRGHLDLLGSRFTLQDGVIEFDGARPPLPRLDVTGVARRADVTARVGLRGRAPAFEVVLESDPPLPRDEVLARVLFGRELSRITPLQGAVLANSLATLQGGGIDALSPLRRVAGLDTLDVGGDAETGAALRAGKYVSERIYVEMQRGVTPESGRARVEVDLGRNLRATTEVHETSRTGVALEWRFDY